RLARGMSLRFDYVHVESRALSSSTLARSEPHSEPNFSVRQRNVEKHTPIAEQDLAAAEPWSDCVSQPGRSSVDRCAIEHHARTQGSETSETCFFCVADSLAPGF